MKNWSLRAKLTAWSALVAGVALLACGIGAVIFLQEEQIEALDDQLRNEAHTFFGNVVWQKVDGQQLERIKAIVPVTRTRRHVEILGPQGETIYVDKNARAEPLPHLAPGLHTIGINRNRARLGIFREDGYTLLLAMDLAELDEDARLLWVEFAIAFPLLVGLVAIGGWCLARSALTPVSEITAAAEKITANHLGQRLPQPITRDEIGRLTEVLNAMFDRLDASFQQAVRFSADASHELKTPLAVLRTSIEDLMESPDLASQDRAAVGALLEQTSRLTSITEVLLLLSRADAGRLQLDFAATDVAEIIHGCVEDARALAEDRQIEIESEIPERLLVAADGRRLAQILLNLFDNAVKYNRPRGRIRVAASYESEYLTVSVSNTGGGIPTHHISKLFDRFFRSDVYPDTPGQGLGLSLARELARAHEGDLTLVQSDPAWTTFCLRIRAVQLKPELNMLSAVEHGEVLRD